LNQDSRYSIAAQLVSCQQLGYYSGSQSEAVVIFVLIIDMVDTQALGLDVGAGIEGVEPGCAWAEGLC